MHCITFVCKKEKRENLPRSRFALSQAYELCLACHCLVWNLVMCQTFCVMAWHGMAWQRFFSSCPLNIMEKKLLLAGNRNNNENIQKNNFYHEQGVALHVYHTFICIHFFEIHFMTIVRIFLMIAGSPLSSKKIHPHFTYWEKQNKRT